MYKLEFAFLATAGLIMWLNHMFYYKTPTWNLGLLGGLIICFFIGFIFIERWRVSSFRKKVAEKEKNEF
jgi:hypothetical protein